MSTRDSTMTRELTWPLWWCLEPEAQVLLMQYQWDTYGFKLTIPPRPSHSTTEMESTEEIDILMRQTRKDY